MPISAALLLRPANLDDGLATINRLVRTITRAAAAKVHGNSLEVAPGIDVTWKQVGDVIAVGNDPQAGTTPGQTLADSQSYQDFLHAAGAPERRRRQPLRRHAGHHRAWCPGTVDPNLKHLGGIAAWTTRGRHDGHVRPVRPGQMSAAAAGRYSPNAVRSAPQISPSVASARTASRIAGIRLS